MKILLVNIFFSIYSKIILSEILIRTKLFTKKKIYYSGYNGSFGYGDHVTFCVNIKNKIGKKGKIFCYSQLQYDTACFLYDKKNIIKSFLPLPKFLNESGIGFKYLHPSKIFNPENIKSPHNKKIGAYHLYYGTKNQIKFIKNNLKRFCVSKKLIEILEKKTITLFVKNFSLKKNANKDLNFQMRQTRNLDKIYKLINYIKRKKIKLIILGTNKDHFMKIIQNKKIVDNKKVYLFKQISKNYSIADQAYLAENSLGYVGNYSGSDAFFQILRRKIINIDMVNWKHLKLWKNNRKCVFKYVIDKKNKAKSILDSNKYYSNKKYIIKETSFEELLNIVKKHFKI